MSTSRPQMPAPGTGTWGTPPGMPVIGVEEI